MMRSVEASSAMEVRCGKAGPTTESYVELTET